MPRAIGEPQRGSRVARSAAKTRRHRNAFYQLDMGAEWTTTSLLEQLQRLDDEIVWTRRNSRHLARRADWPTGMNIQMDFAKLCGGPRRRKGHLIREANR